MTPYMFSTPLRSLVSKDLRNLFFAGRLASFSHVVYGSQVRQAPRWAQKLGQLQPFIAVFLHECMGQLSSSGPA